MEKRTMTANEIAEYLGIGRATVYFLMNTEGFPSFRVGKKLLVDKEKFIQWMEKGGSVNIGGYKKFK